MPSCIPRPTTDRTDDDHPISSDLNPQAKARRIVDTPFQVMYLMAGDNSAHVPPPLAPSPSYPESVPDPGVFRANMRLITLSSPPGELAE